MEVPKAEAASSIPVMEPGVSVVDAVIRLQRAIDMIGNLRLRKWKMTLSSYTALKIIVDRTDLNLAQVARRAFVRPQTMTRIVAQLEERGFVERRPHPATERAIALSPTHLGRQTVAEMEQEVNKVVTAFDTLLGPDQMDTFNTVLRSCARMIESDIRDFEESH